MSDEVDLPSPITVQARDIQIQPVLKKQSKYGGEGRDKSAACV